VRETESKSYKACVVTVSDTRHSGENIDTVGPKLVAMLATADFLTSGPFIVPDERKMISDILVRLIDSEMFDFVVTTGGTGLSQRDVTPESTLDVISREIPGLGECMRFEGSKNTKFAWISRGTGGIRNKSIIVNVPGSERGAIQSLESVLPLISHALQVLKGDTHECGKKMGEHD
jgi:molybdopterin adenylyltransferase